MFALAPMDEPAGGGEAAEPEVMADEALAEDTADAEDALLTEDATF